MVFKLQNRDAIRSKLLNKVSQLQVQIAMGKKKVIELWRVNLSDDEDDE